jgi:hypothetical protein
MRHPPDRRWRFALLMTMKPQPCVSNSDPLKWNFRKPERRLHACGSPCRTSKRLRTEAVEEITEWLTGCKESLRQGHQQPRSLLWILPLACTARSCTLPDVPSNSAHAGDMTRVDEKNLHGTFIKRALSSAAVFDHAPVHAAVLGENFPVHLFRPAPEYPSDAKAAVGRDR